MYYLVGSRFFGDFRDDSDWDYICEDTPKNRELLERDGFYRLQSKHIRYWKHGVDICLVKNLAAQLYARDNVAASLPKPERHAKIRELVHAYELGQVTQLG